MLELILAPEIQKTGDLLHLYFGTVDGEDALILVFQCPSCNEFHTIASLVPEGYSVADGVEANLVMQLISNLERMINDGVAMAHPSKTT